MALPADLVWEIGGTGSVYNGAGFSDLNPGTSVDYSQQANAQLSAGDYATSGSGVAVLTSATGGFTAAMEGNVICLYGGSNFVTGHYQIVTYTNNNTVTLDRSPTPSGAGSGGTGKVGGWKTKFWDAWMDEWLPGHVCWVNPAGTITNTHELDQTSIDGTTHARIQILGYNVTRGDNPTGTDRPLIANGALDWMMGDYYVCRNLRLTTTDANGFYMSADGMVSNCYAYNSSGTASRYAFFLDGTDGTIIQSEGVSTNGRAIRLDPSCVALLCYVHDSVHGIFSNGNDTKALWCIADTCSTYGIGCYSGSVTYNCTTYGSLDNLYIASGRCAVTIRNCLIDSATDDGIAAAAAIVGPEDIDYNNFNGNVGDDVVNVSKGANTTSDDPDFTDDAGGDFSTGAAVQDNGLGIVYGVG